MSEALVGAVGLAAIAAAFVWPVEMRYVTPLVLFGVLLWAVFNRARQ